MSVKKEESGRRSIAVEVEVAGTPEEVWEAIATGPGVSSWFVPTEVDETAGTITATAVRPGDPQPVASTSSPAANPRPRRAIPPPGVRFSPEFIQSHRGWRI
jgi:hypothetical protein